MIDLKKIEDKIDILLDKETKATLEEWLLKNRYKNINKLIGKGSFVSLKTEGVQFKSNIAHANYKVSVKESSSVPSNRFAA